MRLRRIYGDFFCGEKCWKVHGEDFGQDWSADAESYWKLLLLKSLRHSYDNLYNTDEPGCDDLKALTKMEKLAGRNRNAQKLLMVSSLGQSMFKAQTFYNAGI